MLTASCTESRSPPSLHIVGGPIPHACDSAPRAIPFVDTVVLACAEMVVPRPLDGSAPKALGVDREVGHGSCQLFLGCRPAGCLQGGLDDHAGNPALRH